MASPTTLAGVLALSPAPELHVHAGNVQKTFTAADRYGLGPVIWRGTAGTSLVASTRTDPVTGGPAWIDLGGGDRGETFAVEQERARRLAGAHVDVAFAPAFRAKTSDASALARWMDHEMPQARAALAASGWASTLVPVIVLYEDWLTDPNLRAYGISVLASEPGPVAVYLTAVTNPMLRAEAVVGAVDLVRSAGNIIVLRSDEAAIGLVANGALMASVGTSSSARFSYLGSAPKQRRGGRRHPVFHLGSLSWIDSDRLAAFAVGRADRRCPCRVCRLRPVTRYADPALEIDSIAHSAVCLQMVYDRVQGSDDPAVRWIDECLDAEVVSARIARALPQFSDLGASARAWTGTLRTAP